MVLSDIEHQMYISSEELHKTSLNHHFLLRCQARKVTCHVFCICVLDLFLSFSTIFQFDLLAVLLGFFYYIIGKKMLGISS